MRTPALVFAFLCSASAHRAHAAPSHVVGGALAPEGAWPDAVALVATVGDAPQLACTGTLVAPDRVLTAAHCLRSGPLQARLGAPRWQDGEVYEVVTAVEAPLVSTGGKPDLAVLTLDRASTQAPRPLAAPCHTEDLTAGDDVWIVGFGRVDLDATTPSEGLREVRVPLVSPECTEITDGCGAGLPPEAEALAGGRGKDACPGDSGGPLYLPTPEGTLLLGVASRARLGGSSLCGDGGIYVRVDAFPEWIGAQLGQGAVSAECPPAVGETDTDGGLDTASPEGAPPACGGCALPVRVDVSWLAVIGLAGALRRRR